ncbi:hypothetical protein D3C81_1074080 [compost metagenome]
MALDTHPAQYLRQCFTHHLQFDVLDDRPYVQERLTVAVRQRRHDALQLVTVAEHHHVFHGHRVVSLTDRLDVRLVLRERLTLLRGLEFRLMHRQAAVIQPFVFLHAVLVVLQTDLNETCHLVPDRSQGVLRTVLQRDLDFVVIHTRCLDLGLDDLKGNDTHTVGQNLQRLLGFLTEDLPEGGFYFSGEVGADGLEQGDRFRPHCFKRRTRCVHHIACFKSMANVDQVLGTGRLFVEVVRFIDSHKDFTKGTTVLLDECEELLHVVVVNDVVLFAQRRLFATEAVPMIWDALLEEHLDRLDPHVEHGVLRYDEDLGICPEHMTECEVGDGLTTASRHVHEHAVQGIFERGPIVLV